MVAIQLDLFRDPPTENDMIRAEVEEVKESLGKARRGLFARHNDLAKLYLELDVKTSEIEKKLELILDILKEKL